MFDLFQLFLLVILSAFAIATVSLDIEAIKGSDQSSALEGGSTRSKWIMGINYGLLGVASLAILTFFGKIFYMVKYGAQFGGTPKGFDIFQMFILFVMAVFTIVGISLDIETIKGSDQSSQLEGGSTRDKWVMGLNYGMLGVSALAIVLFLMKLYYMGRYGERGGWGRPAEGREPAAFMNPAFEDPRVEAAEAADFRFEE